MHSLISRSNGRLAFGAVFVAAVLGWQPGASACGFVTYSGRATVVNFHGTLLGASGKVVVADTGELSPSGDTRDATVASFSNPGPLKIQSFTAFATTSGVNNTAASQAAAGKFQLEIPGLKIFAADIEAHTAAHCQASTRLINTSGSARMGHLSINNVPMDFPTKENMKMTIPGVATIIFNEKIRSTHSIDINAMHVTLPGAPALGGAEMILAHADSGIPICGTK